MQVMVEQAWSWKRAARARHGFSFLGLAVGTLLLVSRPANLGAEDTPAAVLDHARSVYAALGSYADTGTVLKEYGPSSRDSQSFSTYFTRAPRHFLFDFRRPEGDRLVVWGDPEAFHVWWKATAQVTAYPNPDNARAITLNDYPTSNTVTKIPPLLYSKANLPGALQHFEPKQMTSSDDGIGHRCYRLDGVTSDSYGGTGNRVNVHDLTLWIDVSSYLVRKIVEQSPAPPGSINRITVVFEPRANPTLDDQLFRFAVPK
ncbi:LolA family protein [Terriglobus aquaticus]|uniref:LolA family protein n=1 Tax=Terriglobus aquaticus TaxID=940139 RepID=A0ABW9KLE3_9BACT|nr:hypothetical protein [Terriglobus aquaticus]